MSIVATLLDKAKKTRSIASDMALAELFGVHRQAVSKWRNGDAYPSQDHIAQLAEMAGEDAGDWLVRIHAEREHGPAGKAWSALAKRLAAAAACLLVAAGVTLPGQVQAAPADDYSRNYEASGIYIMRIPVAATRVDPIRGKPRISDLITGRRRYFAAADPAYGPNA